jgi:hypothetical protein
MIFLTPKAFSSRPNLLSRPAWAAAAALLMSASVHSSTEPTADAPAATASETAIPVVTVAPRYSAGNLKLAFGYMDANHDGKISREEAAGFRGVARHFDQADTNHDQQLSRTEFDHAMNYVKPK